MITSDIEKVLFQTAKDKSQSLGCPVHAINGVEDHVHVAVSVVPKIAVSEWVRNIKGIKAHEVNARFPEFNVHIPMAARLWCGDLWGEEFALDCGVY